MADTIYLASASPRRRELLALTGLDFAVRPLDEIDEEALVGQYDGEVTGQAEFLAREKMKLASAFDVAGIFITADTLVISDDGAVLGKPADEDEAALFLDRLAGNWHTVATGVALTRYPSGEDSREIRSVLATTRVKFAAMTDEEIAAYIATGEPFDKAGGYGIQGRASIYIEKIDGCYFNVVGFPLNAFWGMWRKFNDTAL